MRMPSRIRSRFPSKDNFFLSQFCLDVAGVVCVGGHCGGDVCANHHAGAAEATNYSSVVCLEPDACP